MNKRIKIITFTTTTIILLIIIGFLIIFYLNPFNQSEESIREDVLKIIPLGTSMQEVIEIVEKTDNWSIDLVDEDYGYELDKDDGTESGYDEVIGEKSLRILIDDGIIESPEAYCGFDKNSKLIEVTVINELNV